MPELALAPPPFTADGLPGPGWEPAADEKEPGVETARCLNLYAKLASGVCLVTAMGADGPHGMTVSSLTSLSASPPLLLACLRQGSRTLQAAVSRGVFAVHLLPEEDHERARQFADPGADRRRRFDGAGVRRVLGAPVLGDVLAWSVCLLEDARRYGDHVAVVGRVAAVHVGEGLPLLWHERGFRALRPAPRAHTEPAARAG